MLTVQVELDSRLLGGSASFLPFKYAWLASTTCRHLLQHVLDDHFTDRQDALAREKNIKLFCVKKSTSSYGSGSCRATLANATTCMDFMVLSVVDAFSTAYFAFKIASMPTVAPLLPAIINPFDLMRRIQSTFITPPPRLDHAMMYAKSLCIR